MKKRSNQSKRFRASSHPAKELKIAIAKGYLYGPAISLFQRIGIKVKPPPEEERELSFTDASGKYRFFIVRPTDVPVYVEQGATDLGIVGKDVLAEQESSVVELLDLGFGFCQLVLASPASSQIKVVRDILPGARIATKFPRLTEKYFSALEKRIELIKLYGSVELAPHVGLADAIVDLTATGQTLRKLQLKTIDVLQESTAQLIANRIRYKIYYEEIWELCSELSAKQTPKKKSKRS